MHISSRLVGLSVLRASALAVLLVAATRLIPGCSNGPSDVSVGNGNPGGGGGSGSGGGSCSHPEPGCGCNVQGETAPCGTVEVRSGTSIVCSEGKTTCDGSKWGTCIGDITVTENAITGGGLRLQSLGAAAACGEAGVPANPLTSGDGGLSIPAAPGSCMCNEPAQPAQLASAITVSGLPASCTGANDAGVGTDNCNEDYQCVGGTCKPYPAAGVNPACQGMGGSVDYTLGLGCNNGSSWDLTVCNRGFIPTPSLMGTNNLYIAIGAGTPTPSPDPGTCPWPTGPTLPQGAASENGQCIINLNTTPIGPGQCINVNVATQCTQLDGVTPLNALNAQHHWAMVNPPASILPGATTQTECDSCNNYTGLEKGEIGPNSVCVNTNCGTSCGGSSDAGVDGGSGCHTYVTGTVFDPGGNVPLPGVAVFEVQSAAVLPALNTQAACDTCASVLPPQADIVASTGSDINGNFALEVDATSGEYVVFQTGRWRRVVKIGRDTPTLTRCGQKNITVPADCAYPATNCTTRLPQYEADGLAADTAAVANVPLTAIITGSREPFECTILKFMGGNTTEFGRAGGIGLVASSGTNGTLTTTPSASGHGWITSPGGTVVLSNTYVSGNGWETNGFASPTLTLKNLAGMTAAYDNGVMMLAGGTSAANDGIWPIPAAGYVSATSIKITNAAGVNNQVAAGGHYAAAENAGAVVAGMVGGTLTLSGAATGANNGTFPILTAPNSYEVTINNAGEVADNNSGTAGAAWCATEAPYTVTLTGLTGLSAAVGDLITISNSTTASNNGSFTILSTSGTQVTYANALGGCTDAHNGSIHWSVASATPTNTFRFPMYVDTGTPDITDSIGNTALPSAANLWPVLSTYNAFIAGCGGTGSQMWGLSGANQAKAYAFMEQGGKVFVNHWAENGMFVPSGLQGGFASAPFNAVAEYAAIPGNPNSLMTGRVAPGNMTRNGTTAAVNVPLKKTGKYWITQTPGQQGNAATVTTVILPTTTKTGTNWAATFTGPSTLDLTNNTTLAAAYDNGFVALWGGATPAGDNGIWPIQAAGYVSATNVKLTDATGATHVATGNWAAAEPVGTLGAAGTFSGGTLVLAGGATAGNNGTFPILSQPNAYEVTVTNMNAAYDGNNGKAAATWTATAPGTFTISGLTGMGPADVGASITFSGAATGANNGTFIIQSVINATTITITNGGAVTDANNGSINWTETIVTNTGNAGQQQFESWLVNQGAYTGQPAVCNTVPQTTGVCTPTPVDNFALSTTVAPASGDSIEWLRGSNNGLDRDDWVATPGGNFTMIFSFDSNASGLVSTFGADGGAGPGCGRTIASDMHLDTSRGFNGSNNGGSSNPSASPANTFPFSCDLPPALSPNEAAFEYLFFELSACSVGGAPVQNSAPPAPPPPPPLTPATFTHNYEAVCPAGTSVQWSFFQWQATIPMGTSIVFTGATAPDNAGSPGTFGLPVPIGTAASTTGGWTQDNCSVNGHLEDYAVYGNNAACVGSTPASAQASEAWLQITMKFIPSLTVAPVLTGWNQLYDCVPSQ